MIKCLITYIKSELEQNHLVEMIGPIAINYNTVKKYNSTFDIYAIYKSPKINDREFVNYLNDFLNKNKKYGHEKILIGDININIMEDSTIAMEYMNTLATYGFISTITKPTRTTHNSSSCIDHCFVKTKITTNDIVAGVINTKIMIMTQ